MLLRICFLKISPSFPALQLFYCTSPYLKYSRPCYRSRLTSWIAPSLHSLTGPYINYALDLLIHMEKIEDTVNSLLPYISLPYVTEDFSKVFVFVLCVPIYTHTALRIITLLMMSLSSPHLITLAILKCKLQKGRHIPSAQGCRMVYILSIWYYIGSTVEVSS